MLFKDCHPHRRKKAVDAGGTVVPGVVLMREQDAIGQSSPRKPRKKYLPAAVW